MAFFPPIPLIRRNAILRKLKNCGADAPETAKTFAEIGLVNPNGFSRVTEKLVQQGILHRTADGKYYL